MNSYRRSPECRHSSRGQEQVKPCLRRAAFPKQSRAMVLVWETQLVTLKCEDQKEERTGKHISGWKTKRGTGTLQRCTLPQQATCKWILCNFLREKKIYNANYTGMAEQEQCHMSKKAQSSTGKHVNPSELATPCSIPETTAEMWQHSHLSRDRDPTLWLFFCNTKSLLLLCWLGHHLNGLCLQSLTLLTSQVSASQSKEIFSKQQNSTLRNTNQLTGQRQQSQCYTHSNSLSINFTIRKEILKALWTVPCNHHPNVQQ